MGRYFGTCTHTNITKYIHINLSGTLHRYDIPYHGYNLGGYISRVCVCVFLIKYKEFVRVLVGFNRVVDRITENDIYLNLLSPGLLLMRCK